MSSSRAAVGPSCASSTRCHEPRSWEELADRRWRGRLALEAGDVPWYKTLWEYWVEEQARSEDEVDRIFQGIVRNSRVVSGHGLMTELLAAGEFAVAVTSYAHHIDPLIAKKAPLAWKPAVEPIVTLPLGSGVVRSARNPAAAMLFVDWIITDGHALLAEEETDPARKDLALGPGANELLPVDLDSLLDEQDEWTDRYERLFALGEKVPEGE